MYLRIVSTRLVEWIALRLNLVPVPLIHTQLVPLLSQAVLEAHQVNLFDQLATSSQTVAQLAERTQTNPRALGQLLGLLATGGYLRRHGQQYRLTAMARKFCLSTSAYSLHHQQQFNHACQPRWQAHMGQYLQTGQGLESHHTFSPHEWNLYQQGMNTLPPSVVAQMVARLPLPRHATHLLDIGGAHGQYALAFANAHPGLSITVLDLPEALASAPAGRAISNAITYLPGNALTYLYPAHAYDAIFISNLLHHFDAQTAAALCVRACKALKPGGIFIIQEFLKPNPAQTDFAAAALDLYFSLTSSAGCYTQPQLMAMVAAAGCTGLTSRNVWQLPGLAQVWGNAPG